MHTKLHTGAKPLHIIFDKVDGYIKKYDRTKYLALFHSDEKYERIFDRIKYLFILYIRINSGNDLPLEKMLNMHDVVILIKSIFYKNHNHYYYEKFLEKCLCK